MDGRELAAAARQIRPDLKILYTSGYADQAVLPSESFDPTIPLLSKPYHPSVLAQKIQEVLNQ